MWAVFTLNFPTNLLIYDVDFWNGKEATQIGLYKL
jgi:hypothetical protein